jgi:MFS family permease
MKKLMNNTSLAILLSTNSLILLATAMLGPIYAVLIEDIGGDVFDAGASFSVFAISAALVTLVSGRYTDKIAGYEKYPIILGYSLIGLGFFLFTFVDSLTSLMLVQIIIGIGEATYSPPFDASYSEHLDKKSYATEWGFWESMNYFTLAIGGFLGGALVRAYNFDTLFMAMGALCLLSIFILIVSPRRLV